MNPSLGALLLVLLVLRLEALLVADELLLHEQVVLDSLLPQQSESALRVWHDIGQLLRLLNTSLLLFTANPGRSSLLSSLL